MNLVVISSLRFIFSKTFDDSGVVYAFIVKVTVWDVTIYYIYLLFRENLAGAINPS